MLERLGKLLQGKKTYIIAVLIGAGAIATQLGYVVPDAIWYVLSALGLGAVRSALDKLNKP